MTKEEYEGFRLSMYDWSFTEQGFLDVFKLAKQQEWWVDFIESRCQCFESFDFSYCSAWKFIDLIGPRFAEELVEFLGIVESEEEIRADYEHRY